jgi:hypothetical protein
VTSLSLSESSQGEVGDNREKWGEFWEKLIATIRNRGEYIKITGMQDSNQGRQK